MTNIQNFGLSKIMDYVPKLKIWEGLKFVGFADVLGNLWDFVDRVQIGRYFTANEALEPAAPCRHTATEGKM
jgi:hypothetical protein